MSISVRQIVIPFDSSSKLVSIDFSGIEYRLLAHFSREEKLVKLFREGGDFHTEVARQLFDIPSSEEVPKEKRFIGKTFNFSQLYGAAPASMAAKLDIPLRKCELLVKRYNRIYRKVDIFKRKVTQYCIRKGGIRNPFGRWRELPKELAYTAVNTLIQSTAADILKVAILRVDRFLIDKKSRLLFPVHDELVINWHREDGNIITPIVQLMEKHTIGGKPMFSVPIEVEVSICEGHWGNKKAVDFKKGMEIVLSQFEHRSALKLKIDKNPLLKKWSDFIHTYSEGLDEDFKEETIAEIDYLMDNGNDKKRWRALLIRLRDELEDKKGIVDHANIKRDMPPLPWQKACKG